MPDVANRAASSSPKFSDVGSAGPNLDGTLTPWITTTRPLSSTIQRPAWAIVPLGATTAVFAGGAGGPALLAANAIDDPANVMAAAMRATMDRCRERISLGTPRPGY